MVAIKQSSNHSQLVQGQMEMSKYIGKRKHVSQLDDLEKGLIWKNLKDIKLWSMNGHTLDRLREKGINATYDDLVSTIDDATIIEYKIDYNKHINRCEERVVLRANSIVNIHYNLNVVYSITTQKIITVWMNDIDDKHTTLNWDIYSEDMKVFLN